MTMTVETPPPDRIRPAAVAGLLLGDLIAPAAIYYAAKALGAPVVLALILGGLACLPRQVAELVQATADYERQMVDYGFAAVRASRSAELATTTSRSAVLRYLISHLPAPR